MVPTIPWMKEKFAEYNQKYFGGKLRTPRFSIENLESIWGKYDADATYSKITHRVKPNSPGTIVLTGHYSRKEGAVISTLLHEMCHMYVYTVLCVYPKDQHGKEFMSIANQINGMGHQIANETPFTDDDIEGGGNSEEGCVLCVIEFQGRPDIKWWVCKAERNQIPAFRNRANALNGVKSVRFFESESNALFHVESDPQNLPGWGGMVYRNVAIDIAKHCGEPDFHVFMPESLGGTMTEI